MVSQLKTNSGFHPNRFDLIFKVFIVQTFYFHFQILIVSSWRNDCWCILYLFLFFFKFIYYVPSVMPVTCHDGSMNFSKSMSFRWISFISLIAVCIDFPLSLHVLQCNHLIPPLGYFLLELLSHQMFYLVHFIILI